MLTKETYKKDAIGDKKIKNNKKIRKGYTRRYYDKQ